MKKSAIIQIEDVDPQKMKKSNDDEDVAKAQALWEQMMRMDAPVCDISEYEDAEYQFKQINGELVLLLIVVTTH